jgi:hypothetical protein
LPASLRAESARINNMRGSTWWLDPRLLLIRALDLAAS